MTYNEISFSVKGIQFNNISDSLEYIRNHEIKLFTCMLYKN